MQLPVYAHETISFFLYCYKNHSAGPCERLKATRAAELDADRLLAERLYGVQVDADTTVADLATSGMPTKKVRAIHFLRPK